jgi:aminopeptidase-like protein
MLEVMLDDVLTPLFEKNAYFRTVVKNKLLDFDQKVQTLNMSYSTALRFSNAMTALRAHIYAIETAK